MIAHDQKFENVTIYLDGSSFYRCQFERCNLIFCGVLGFVLDNPTMTNCNWIAQGPALQTLQMLGTLYKAGAVDLVEGIIRNIKGEQGAPNPGKSN